MNIVDGVLVSVTSPSENLVLPKVFEIGEEALKRSSIKSVVIPEGVRVIRARAFEDCEDLRSVQLPSSLRRIDDFAFSSTHLREIVLPYGVELGKSVFFDSWLSMVVADTDDEWQVPLYKLPPSCRVVSSTLYTALKKLGADKQWRQNESMMRVRIPRVARAEDDMPRISKRQAMKKTRKPRKPSSPKPPKIVRKRRPRTPEPRGPRGKGECTICLKPSCEHLNISRRLGAPVMW
jgi:hypothetical protein